MSAPQPPESPELVGEGNLHDLTDDQYFDAIAACPPILDAAGEPLQGVFDDVVDARAEKRAAADRGEEFRP